MSRKQIFEIPENPDSVIFYAGREISIDGKTIVEVDTASACFRHLMTDLLGGVFAACRMHQNWIKWKGTRKMCLKGPGNCALLR